jgi:hypothetical protein
VFKRLKGLEKLQDEIDDADSQNTVELTTSQLVEDSSTALAIASSVLANKRIKSVAIKFSLRPLAADALIHALTAPQSKIVKISFNAWRIWHESQQPIMDREEEYPAAVAAYNAAEQVNLAAYAEFLRRNAEGLAFAVPAAGVQAQPLIFRLPPLPVDFLDKKLKPFIISPAPHKTFVV